ncbi:MAG: bifunctional phosphopantothenoylcysteine decarboxylase/phosphopantothenate--cysteine ligase CoaBC [Leptospirales bacterium]
MSSSKRVLLGITGSIAAYRSLDIARLLRQEGHDIQMVATRSALRFFPRLNGEVFTGHPVYSDLFDTNGGGVRHIELADKSQIILIAPASADFIAKLALGLADDLLSTICLAATCPIVIAPAMEEKMYFHPAIQEHLKTLRARRVLEIPPEKGPLASGKEGIGRLPSPEQIREAIQPLMNGSDSWAGIRVLVSAGPTYEPIDPVRFLGNRSSGKMGYAFAKEALSRGAAVTLVSGPTNIPTPVGARVFQIETAREMEENMQREFPSHDLCIMAAAVGDYRISSPTISKRKKDGKDWEVLLCENPDILSGLSQRKKNGQFLVGFAAETEMEAKLLVDKATRKGVDILLANDVSKPGIGFSSDKNDLTLVTPSGEILSLGHDTKQVLAGRALDEVWSRWKHGSSNQGQKHE